MTLNFRGTGSFGSYVSFLTDQNPGYEADGTAGQIGDDTADEEAADEPAEDSEVTFINNLDHPAFKATLLKSRQHCCNPYLAQDGCTVEVFWHVDNKFYTATVVQNNITALVVDFHKDNERLGIYLANIIWYIKQRPVKHCYWCPYFNIWYFDTLKKHDVGPERSNASSSISSIVAVSVGSNIDV